MVNAAAQSSGFISLAWDSVQSIAAKSLIPITIVIVTTCLCSMLELPAWESRLSRALLSVALLAQVWIIVDAATVIMSVHQGSVVMADIWIVALWTLLSAASIFLLGS